LCIELDFLRASRFQQRAGTGMGQSRFRTALLLQDPRATVNVGL